MSMDFYTIKEKSTKKGTREIYPEFRVCRSRDLMVRGKAFYAIWDKDRGMWSTDEYDVQRMVDEDLRKRKDEIGDIAEDVLHVKYMLDFSNKTWLDYQSFLSHVGDNYHQLDEKLTFSNQEVTKTDYVSRRLNYPLASGDYSAWDELIGTLYLPEERQKIEWAIGAIVTGDSREIQKFLVFYGEAGAGKSTILNVIQKLFQGYYVMFDAKALTGTNNQFAMEAFRSNPLVAIQHDGDLSRIEDNTKLNSIVSHEEMLVNEKFKSAYTMRANCFLFMATNRPVKITDAKSGILRRLIDVKPSLQKIPFARYQQLMKQVEFELGAIAWHCKEVYEKTGKNFYDSYRPKDMMYKTDEFFNFVDDCYLIFSQEDGTTLKSAYEMYKHYCDESGIAKILPMYKFREELKNYFSGFDPIARIDGKQVRSWYSGFDRKKFSELQKGEKMQDAGETNDGRREHGGDGSGTAGVGEDPGQSGEGKLPDWLRIDLSVSLLDQVLAAQPAQYANDEDKPQKKWSDVTSALKDIDTSKTHYVRIPQNHIVIDFDLKDEHGDKSLERNLEAAGKWKPTYAEVSKGGNGLHLHYIWDGDIQELAPVFEPGIEIKTFRGNSSLRRRVSRCNDIPIAHLSSGLPQKEAKKTVNFDAVKSEKGLRNLIERNLNKEIHPGTKPSIDFIEKILNDAYESGLKYDVTDMRPDITDFAIHSSHQSAWCLTRVAKMKFKSEDPSEPVAVYDTTDDRFVFFDIEVFPNLVLVNWKYAGDDVCQRMINPKPFEIEELVKHRLIGFNCRRYDNHILYAVMIGKSIPEIYDISQGIIAGSKNCSFGEAYNISYTDVYDFAATKQSLKKWEIELGIHHQELGLPWDQPVPEEKWLQVAEYCDNDVFATEAVFNHLSADWTARQILADIAGMTVNDTTNSLTTRIIFGKEKNPQSVFNYRNLGLFTLQEINEKAYKLPGDEDGSDPHLFYELYDRYGKMHDVDLAQYVYANELSKADGNYGRMQEADHTWFDEKGRPVFPGYTFDRGVSMYRGEEVGEGGYVYAEPGIHRNVALLDIASMHPSSLIAEELFGPVYTKHFADIKQARIYIKHKDYDKAKELFGGRLAKYLDDPAQAKALAGALKIAINSVYGLTSAKFDNAFRDTRNIDNIVAKRGALFMVNLKHEVQRRGFTVAHIKTDSIKIPDATPEIIRFVMDYGKLYGYTFEHEATYDRMCLVNYAVYIARYSEDEFNEHPGEWTATGTQFQVPYVFKTLFSHEPIRFEDLTETKSCTTALYLDMNEKMPDVSMAEKEYDKLRSSLNKIKKEHGLDIPKLREYFEIDELCEILPADTADKVSDTLRRIDELKAVIAKGHDYVFIGKVGLFAPVKPGYGGGLLMREKEGKYYAVGGTSGYRWLEAETTHDRLEDIVDMRYFRELVDGAKEAVEKYGDFEDFVSGSPCSTGGLPWTRRPMCGETTYESCLDCPHWKLNLEAPNVDETYGCDIL